MNVRINFVYKAKKGIASVFESDMMEAEKALLIAQDLMQTGRVSRLEFIDDLKRTWSIKTLTNYLIDIVSEPHHIRLYFDGGFDKERQLAGLGVVIYYQQDQKAYRLRKNALVEGLSSNNEAEYAALHLGLKELEFLGVHHMPVAILGDSLVVIKQLSDEWPVYDQVLDRWIDRIEETINKLGIHPEYQSLSRQDNKEADQLATQALQGIQIMSQKEID